MLRQQRDARTLDPEIAAGIDGGRLAPDDLVTALVRLRTEMPDATAGYLLDGYPRTLAQAKMWDAILTDRGQTIDAVVHLYADRGVLIGRLLDRAVREGRADDVRETIDRRLEIYQRRTDPVLDYYREAALVRPVDADRDAEVVFEEVLSVVCGSGR